MSLSDSPVSVTRLAIPVTIAVAAGWIVATVVYNAGSKVTSSDKDIAYLVSRMDALQTQVKDLSEKITGDHDAVIRLDQRTDSLESQEAGKDIHISMGDDAAKAQKATRR